MYTRNHDTAPPIWRFWRETDIGAADMALHGWWSDAPPVTLGLRDACACSIAPTSVADPEGAATAVLVTAHVARGRLAVLVLVWWCVCTACTHAAHTHAACTLHAPTLHARCLHTFCMHTAHTLRAHCM